MVLYLVILENAIDFAMHEHMHQFMLQNMFELGQGTIGRNYNSSFQKLEKSSHPFGDDVRDSISLLEVSVSGVKNQRDFTQDIVVELSFQKSVYLFSMSGADLGQLAHL